MIDKTKIPAILRGESNNTIYDDQVFARIPHKLKKWFVDNGMLMSPVVRMALERFKNELEKEAKK